MTTFNVEIQPKSTFGPTIMMLMEPGKDVMEVAEKLSLAYPEQKVTVEMFARVRRTYLNGQVISSRPDLAVFYTDLTPQDHWDWSCLGSVKD